MTWQEQQPLSQLHEKEVRTYYEYIANELLSDGVATMFGFERDSEMLLPEEKADAERFVRYAAKALVEGAANSPIAQDLIQNNEIHEVVKKLGPTPGSAHDFWHATIAYAQTEGASLVPAYLQAASLEGQWVDTAAIQEEMMVYLLERGGSDTAADMILQADPSKAIRSVAFGEKDVKNCEEVMSPFASLFETNHFEYCMRLFETDWRLDQKRHSRVGADRAAEVDHAMDYIQENRSPAYVRIFRDVYDNARSANLDPKFTLRVFERITEPLLERLRQEEESQKI